MVFWLSKVFFLFIVLCYRKQILHVFFIGNSIGWCVLFFCPCFGQMISFEAYFCLLKMCCELQKIKTIQFGVCIISCNICCINFSKRTYLFTLWVYVNTVLNWFENNVYTWFNERFLKCTCIWFLLTSYLIKSCNLVAVLTGMCVQMFRQFEELTLTWWF